MHVNMRKVFTSTMHGSYGSAKMIMVFLYSMHTLPSNTQNIVLKKIDGEKALKECELYMEWTV